jgi:hypothetical protein
MFHLEAETALWFDDRIVEEVSIELKDHCTLTGSRFRENGH